MAEPAFSWTDEDTDSWTDEDTETSATAGYAGTEPDEPAFPRVSTLLNLVQTVQDRTSSDEEVVAVITHLLSTRRVRLGGIFAGRLIEVAA